MRHEIEHALDTERVILPMYSERFSFSEFDEYMTPSVATRLRRYNAIQLPHAWSPSTVRRLHEEYLQPRPVPKVRVSKEAAAEAERILQEVRGLPKMTANALAAQRKFEEAQALTIEGNDVGAIAAYTSALKLKPDFADAFNGRGSTFRSMGDNEKALHDFGQAVRLMPNMHEALQNRGCARHDSGDHHGAVTDFTEAIRLKPDYVRAFRNRAAAYEAMNDDVRARADLDEAVRLGPDEVALYRRALLRTKSDDPTGATEDLSRAIKLDPSFALAFFWRGMLRERQGDEDGAIADWKRSKELDPNSSLQFVFEPRRDRSLVGGFVAGSGDWQRRHLFTGNCGLLHRRPPTVIMNISVVNGEAGR